MIKKSIKPIARLTIHQSCQKNTQNDKYQYFIIPCANSPPPKKKKRAFQEPSKYPPRTPQNRPRRHLDPQGPFRSSQGLSGASLGPSQDASGAPSRAPQDIPEAFHHMKLSIFINVRRGQHGLRACRCSTYLTSNPPIL